MYLLQVFLYAFVRNRHVPFVLELLEGLLFLFVHSNLWL